MECMSDREADRSEASTKVSRMPVLATILRWLVEDSDFTIVSNNCWGAHFYQLLGIEYRTPFVGLFIPPKSYLELLRGFDHYIHAELAFRKESMFPAINEFRSHRPSQYPIGLLDERIELHFQHYRSEGEARCKWTRRCKRITENPRRRFFKFDDREGATTNDIREFCTLPFRNKVCFTHSKYDLPTIVVPGEPGTNHVCDGLELSKISRRYFNGVRWVSTRPTQIPMPSLL
jgi:uncharacterized protein (DUF1919 family)